MSIVQINIVEAIKWVLTLFVNSAKDCVGQILKYFYQNINLCFRRDNINLFADSH